MTCNTFPPFLESQVKKHDHNWHKYFIGHKELFQIAEAYGQPNILVDSQKLIGRKIRRGEVLSMLSNLTSTN